MTKRVEVKCKTGPRPPKYGCTLKEIAAVEHCSVATVERTLNSGVRKLHHIPGAFEGLLAAIYAVDASLAPRCGSVECDARYIELFADDCEAVL